jgi:hypothetical protein
VSGVVELPADVDLGPHRIELSGIDPDGMAHQASADLLVTAGVPIGVYAVLLASALAAGGAIVLFALSRRLPRKKKAS